MVDKLKNEKMHHLFCQHCKALQKVTGIDAECWYNPMDEDKRLAFCAANIDAVTQILNLFKSQVGGLSVIGEEERTPLTELTPDERFHCEEVATIGIVGDDEEAHQEYNRNLNGAIKWMIAHKVAQAQLQDCKDKLLGGTE